LGEKFVRPPLRARFAARVAALPWLEIELGKVARPRTMIWLPFRLLLWLRYTHAE
jgi:hypothetical protein